MRVGVDGIDKLQVIVPTVSDAVSFEEPAIVPHHVRPLATYIHAPRNDDAVAYLHDFGFGARAFFVMLGRLDPGPPPHRDSCNILVDCTSRLQLAAARRTAPVHTSHGK